MNKYLNLLVIFQIELTFFQPLSIKCMIINNFLLKFTKAFKKYTYKSIFYEIRKLRTFFEFVLLKKWLKSIALRTEQRATRERPTSFSSVTLVYSGTESGT